MLGIELKNRVKLFPGFGFHLLFETPSGQLHPFIEVVFGQLFQLVLVNLLNRAEDVLDASSGEPHGPDRLSHYHGRLFFAHEPLDDMAIGQEHDSGRGRFRRLCSRGVQGLLDRVLALSLQARQTGTGGAEKTQAEDTKDDQSPTSRGKSVVVTGGGRGIGRAIALLSGRCRGLGGRRGLRRCARPQPVRVVGHGRRRGGRDQGQCGR